MFATQVLSEDLSENIEKEDDNLEVVGFILVNDSTYEIKKGETKIGREPTMCSIVIDNFTVSKVHAIIESEGTDDTFIYDAESTNQTKLGKKTLKPYYRHKLENDSNITFGNITAKFMLPLNIRRNSESRSNLENFKASHGMEDIFDVVTQVSVPHPHTSGDFLQFKKEPDNFQSFKNPDLDSREKVKESLQSQKDSAKVTECHLVSQDLVSRTEHYSSSYDNSGIFSLSTQCQIIQPCSSKDNKSEDKVPSDNHRNNELDSIKALLCDGQDSVLCTFMSLHSPGGQAPKELSKKIKTEVVQEGDSQLFDVQTQVQAVPIQSNSQKNIKQASQFNEDLCSQNLPKPNQTGSSHLGNGTELNPPSTAEKLNNDTKDSEEDFIKTQEFNSSPLEECRTAPLSVPVGDNVPWESGTECYFEKAADLSVAEELSENEDLICTQKYEVFHNGIQGTTNSAPENENLNESSEDFMETQLYDFEKEHNNNNKGPEEVAGKPTAIPFVVSESPEKGTEPYVEVNTDFTQKSMEEDLISTQAFSEITLDRNANDSNSRSSGSNDDYNDDEDFIATQPVDLLLDKTAKNKFSEEPISVQTASRESSPDFLDSWFSSNTSRDFKSIRPKTSAELLEKTDSVLLTHVKKELNENITIFPMKSVERIESSGEETESDLEIIFEKNYTSEKIKMIGEFSEKSRNAESYQLENNTTARNSEVHENNDSNSSYIFQLEAEAHADVAPNLTLTKQNIVPDQVRAAESDSDVTDCEDNAVVGHEVPVEQDIPGKIASDETQLPTSTPSNKASSPDDGCKDDEESPSFEIGKENECWNQLSLVLPDTQDMESTINKILCNADDTVAEDPDPKKEADYQKPSKILKTEVKVETFGSSSIRSKPERQIDSPLKRLVNNDSEIEGVPPKKSKIETSDRQLRSSEKQFLKLWQVHNIEQIQPCRTRSSLKNGGPENKPNKIDIALGNNISNKFATSRRESRPKRKNATKLSFDITPYLSKEVQINKRTFLEGRKKETSPKENGVESKPECCCRVLRSSRRNSGNILPPGSFEYPARQASTRSRRTSRFKKEDYFNNSCVNVIFTGFDCEALEKIISTLGGNKTNDLSVADVVVTDKVRRTVKFLSAIALTLPITSPQWLLACRAEKKFLNPWNFILKDEESERKWGFELKASLERSKNVKLMQGLSVFATASAKPPMKDLMAIVKYCGGTPLFQPPDIWPKKTVIVSCPEDKKCWPLAKYRNIKIVHYELILIGILRQQLDFKTYKLR